MNETMRSLRRLDTDTDTYRIRRSRGSKPDQYKQAGMTRAGECNVYQSLECRWKKNFPTSFIPQNPIQAFSFHLMPAIIKQLKNTNPRQTINPNTIHQNKVFPSQLEAVKRRKVRTLQSANLRKSSFGSRPGGDGLRRCDAMRYNAIAGEQCARARGSAPRVAMWGSGVS